jgi:NAD(P)-dependent dehydrogenase (short-subunit alcohol dehydrogenase family)
MKGRKKMKEFQDKVAVITGAASGIGLALAEGCVAEGMKVVLADIEEAELVKTEKALKDAGGEVLSAVTDVTKKGDIQALEKKTMDVYGAVHLLCNNAGVGAGSTVWEASENDWKWVLGVNLWGVIYGNQEFVPIMLKQETECHILNTASAAGLLPYHGSAPYQVSKHAVVALSEKMYYDLGENKGNVKVSVLCPGWVKTRILESERVRPSAYQNDPADVEITPETLAMMQQFQQSVETGMAPEVLADHVFKAIKDDQFYIIPNPEYIPIFKARMDAIVQVSNPMPLAMLTGQNQA